jgi:hypothetical protein
MGDVGRSQVILLNFVPEIFIVMSLFGSLFLMAFSRHTRGAMPLLVSSVAFGGLLYFVLRPDLSFFDSPDSMILSDSMSFFLRLVALLALGAFSFGVFFHTGISVRDKQRSVLFLQFFSLFLCGMALSQNLVAFLVSALGIYISSMSITLIESAESPSWVTVFREKSVWFSIWAVLIAMLFVLSSSLFDSINFSTWPVALRDLSGQNWLMATFVVLVFLCGIVPSVSSVFVGKAPLGLAILAFGLLLVTSTFWIRIGVPVLGIFTEGANPVPRWILGVVLSFLAIRSAVYAILTREHHAWISAIYPVLGGIPVFSILLPGELAVPALFVLTIGTLFTLLLVSHAFLESEYRNKALILFALIAVPGAPPLVMGERYYQMIFDLLGSSNFVAAAGLAVVWLMLLLASTQIIGKILLVRVSKGNQRSFTRGEVFFLGFYLMGVIALSSLRPQLIAVLNRHPPLNLW